MIIDEGSCVNIIVKTALEKMSLKAKLYPHPDNVNRVIKTTQSIIQRCQVSIYMSSYEDHVYCDVLNIDIAHILLGGS